MWIASLISIIILYFVYAYLKNLNTCDCVNNTYSTRLQNLETILLGVNSIFLLFYIFDALHMLGNLEKLKKHIYNILIITGFAILLFYSYFIYNAYEFWHTMKSNCACADKWQKYYIYFQAISFFLTIFGTILLLGSKKMRSGKKSF